VTITEVYECALKYPNVIDAHVEELARCVLGPGVRRQYDRLMDRRNTLIGRQLNGAILSLPEQRKLKTIRARLEDIEELMMAASGFAITITLAFNPGRPIDVEDFHAYISTCTPINLGIIVRTLEKEA